jgi:tRNA A-37 threonylcarbamoyl transferase component Bud32
MNLSGTLAGFIEDTVEAHKDSGIVACSYNGECIWVKKSVVINSGFAHKWQNMLARILNIEVLKTPAKTAENQQLEHEGRCLKKLAAQGFHVPQVIAQGQDWLALSDVGTPIIEQWSVNNDLNRAKMAQLSAKALANLHKKGHWHGRPTLNNLTFDDDEIGFIGFDPNLSTAMHAKARQARDVIIFFHDLMRYCEYDSLAAKQAMIAYKKYAPQEVLLEVQGFYKKSSGLKKLCRLLSRLAKKEIEQTLAMLNCLNFLLEEHNIRLIFNR